MTANSKSLMVPYRGGKYNPDENSRLLLDKPAMNYWSHFVTRLENSDDDFLSVHIHLVHFFIVT